MCLCCVCVCDCSGAQRPTVAEPGTVALPAGALALKWTADLHKGATSLRL